MIEDIQGARIREEVLPLDTFGQTEVVNGRIEVSINSRIIDMPNVKYAEGVAYTTLWHESVHIEQDINPKQSEDNSAQLMLSGFEPQPIKLVVCRSTREIDRETSKREFFTENAAIAAAISSADLNRTRPFLEFQRVTIRGGDLGGSGWSLLYRVAEDIGVNITALVRYFQQRGLCHVIKDEGKPRLIGNPQLSEGIEWL